MVVLSKFGAIIALYDFAFFQQKERFLKNIGSHSIGSTQTTLCFSYAARLRIENFLLTKPNMEQKKVAIFF